MVAATDANLSVFDVRAMEDRLYELVAQPRCRTALLGVFAALALVMAVVGLYAVMAINGPTNLAFASRWERRSARCWG